MKKKCGGLPRVEKKCLLGVVKPRVPWLFTALTRNWYHLWGRTSFSKARSSMVWKRQRERASERESKRKVMVDLIKTNQTKGLCQCCNDWLIVCKRIFLDLLKSTIYMFLSITSQFLLGENGDDNGLFVSKVSWSDGLKFKAPIRGCWNHVPGWAQSFSVCIR